MYTFHCLGKQAPSFLTEDAERLTDFKSRLQYLARGVQVRQLCSVICPENT